MTDKISKALWSTTSAKAAKATGFGYINAIHYMAPHTIAGVGNLCPFASPGCAASCLGYHTGQASMVKGSADVNNKNSVRRSRDTKARQYMRDRGNYRVELHKQIAKLKAKAARENLRLALRFNGSTDVTGEPIFIAAAHPEVPVNEYTKSVRFALANARGEHPANLRVCFSRSETNEADCLKVLAEGGIVSVVFRGDIPSAWNGYETVDGDKHDLLHKWPRGVVVALKAKGAAKRDTTGFVVG